MTGCLLPLVSRLTRLGQARPDPLLPALRSPRDRGELAAAEAAAFSARMMFLPSLCFCTRWFCTRWFCTPAFCSALAWCLAVASSRNHPGGGDPSALLAQLGVSSRVLLPLDVRPVPSSPSNPGPRFFFSGTGSGEAMPGRDHRSWLRSWLCAQALDLCPGRSSDGSFAVPGLEFRFGPATCCPRSRSAKHA